MNAQRKDWLLRLLLIVVCAALAVAIMAKPGESKEIYCAKHEGSGDAVLLDKASPWAKVVAKLKLNEKLEVLDDKTSKTYIKVKAGGVEGWIKRGASSEDVTPIGGEQATTSTTGKGSSAAAKGLNSQIENDVKSGSEKYAQNLAVVDKLQITFNEKVGGGNRVVTVTDSNTGFTDKQNQPADSEKVRNAIMRFGVDGGLLKLNP